MSAPLMASGDAQHLQSRRRCLGRALAARVQTHGYVHAAVAQVERVRVALAAVTDNGYCLAF